MLDENRTFDTRLVHLELKGFDGLEPVAAYVGMCIDDHGVSQLGLLDLVYCDRGT
jgi:hypothetical protein